MLPKPQKSRVLRLTVHPDTNLRYTTLSTNSRPIIVQAERNAITIAQPDSPNRRIIGSLTNLTQIDYLSWRIIHG